jgi:protein-S-isoprenylcysteine O-methyltransferase Ste14
MTAPWNPFASLSLLTILVAAAFFVFARVRSDYRNLGKLSRPVAILQFGFFCGYALASYAFLDSRLAHIQTSSWLFPLALVWMVVGFVIVLFSMPFLGMRSFGNETGHLKTGGLYRYSRNPQLVGGFLFMVGYAMLWPSWQGAVWVSLWLLISYLMVRGEEDHLQRLFGEEYRGYCQRTPRYLGTPRGR